MIKNQLKTFVLIAVLTALLLFVGQLIGGYAGLIIGGAFALLMNFITYFFSDKIVLALYHAKEVPKDHEVYKLVHEIVQLANLPMPRVYTVPSPSPNAFATGRNPKHAAIACTEGILTLLSKDELRGVLAHEVSHIKNRDILITTIAATIAGVISYIANMAGWAAMFGGFGGNRDDNGGNNLVRLLVLAIITPIIAMLLQLAISRSREYLADETGAKTIHNPVALAHALEKIHHNVAKNPMRFGNESTASLFIANPFSAKGMIHLLSTHPPMEERVKRLKKMA